MITFLGAPVNIYAFCIAVGLIAMCVTACVIGRKKRILLEDTIFGGLFIIIGAFIGAHILSGITFIIDTPKVFEGFADFWSKGKFDKIFELIAYICKWMVFSGGLILGTVFALLYCKFRKLDFRKFSDCFAVGVPLFLGIAKIGCFFAGYKIGIESGFGFVDQDGVTRFPVQLLESLLYFAIFAAFIVLFQKGIMEGQLIYLFMLIYAPIRFFIEFLRGVETKGFILFLSTSQWVCIILIAFALYKLFGKNKLKKSSQESPDKEKVKK